MKLHMRYIRNYKKNTLSIFLCFVLTLALMTAMLTLINTNHRVSALQNMMIYSPADIRIKNLDADQVRKLEEHDGIKKTAVFEAVENLMIEDEIAYVERTDPKGMTMTCELEAGRLPKADYEIVVEKWVLLNMGLEPVVGHKLTGVNEETGEEVQFEVVGILSDVLRNKQIGMLAVNAPLRSEYQGEYLVYVSLEDKEDLAEHKKVLQEELGITAKQIQDSPGREDLAELFRMDAGMSIVILLICVVVFSGIYRIAVSSRESQYGVLRAIGIRKKKLRQIILGELFAIYAPAAPIGIILGFAASWTVLKLTGEENQVIYLWGEAVTFTLIIPWTWIILCVLLQLVMISLIGNSVCRRICGQSVIATMFQTNTSEKYVQSHKKIDKSKSRKRAVLVMSWKYLLRDWKTSIYTVLTICIGVTLFSGLLYQGTVAGTIHYETKEMYFLNGDYSVNVMGFQEPFSGLTESAVREMEKSAGVTEVQTASGIPIRVIDDPKVQRYEAYYNEIDSKRKDIYGYGMFGDDGVVPIYKTVMYGYNEAALSSLQNYITAGASDLSNLKEDEIVVCMMSVNHRKQDDGAFQNVGWYKNGDPLMEYKVGDTIDIKYRADFDTENLAYAELTDSDAEYTYRTYKIAAIASFSYMFDPAYETAPLLITGAAQVRDICPDIGVQSMYINSEDTLTAEEQRDLEKSLIRIGADAKDIRTRSLIAEREKADMLYQKQMVYIYGIAIVFLILALINISNNLKYRMQIRKSEIAVYRAIGMKMRTVRWMVLFENCMLGLISVAISLGLSYPVTRYLFSQSDMEAFGYQFYFNIPAFLGISVITIAICAVMSWVVTRGMEGHNIMEDMAKIE